MKFTEIPFYILKDFLTGTSEVIYVNGYTITTISDGNCFITPYNPLVSNGDSVTLSFLPVDGYKISNVIIDGVSQGSITEYKFENVTENHSVEVMFESAVISHFEDWVGILNV